MRGGCLQTPPASWHPSPSFSPQNAPLITSQPYNPHTAKNKEDVMIILGDAGINYSGGIRDMRKKEFLESLPITVFAIHGNHEQRPQTIEGYQEKVWPNFQTTSSLSSPITLTLSIKEAIILLSYPSKCRYSRIRKVSQYSRNCPSPSVMNAL